MNQKGTGVLVLVFELIVTVLIVVLLLTLAKGYASSDYTIIHNTAWDVQMMVNTLVGTPGNVLVEYPHNVSSLSLFIDGTGVTVSTKEKEKREKITDFTVRKKIYLPESYAIRTDKALETANIEKICLQKNNKEITLFPCPS